MFTLTTNLAIWMAAVVDESVHQAHSHSNASHSRLTPDRECPLQGTLARGLPGLGLGALCTCRVSLPCPHKRGVAPSCSGL